LRWFPEPPHADHPPPLAALFAARGRPDLKAGQRRVLSVWAPARWKPLTSDRCRPWESLDAAPVTLLRVGEVDLGGGLSRTWLCWDPARQALCRAPRPGDFEDCIYGEAADIAGLVAELVAALDVLDAPPAEAAP
ncbi:MAG: hypothetical protein KC613_05165, partial [Myxococcales bacterium]|nr:hypothetical protein [Myxococcales bacterium]